MTDHKTEAAMHGPESMSDERLARVRQGAQALAEAAAAGHPRTWAEGVVPELVTEVDRLRALTKAQSDLLAEYQRWGGAMRSTLTRRDAREMERARQLAESTPRDAWGDAR